jgi:hypothetical protein
MTRPGASASELGGKVFKATHRAVYNRARSPRYSPGGLIASGELAGSVTVAIDYEFPGTPAGLVAVRERSGTYFVAPKALSDVQRVW